MRTLFVLGILAVMAIAAPAADVTGTWTGTFTTPSGDGGEREGTAHLVLKQDGVTLTGTAGPGPEEQMPLNKGKIENGRITFELSHGDGSMKFTLTVEGDEIKGQATREQNGQSQTAKLSVKRKK